MFSGFMNTDLPSKFSKLRVCGMSSAAFMASPHAGISVTAIVQ